MRLESNEIAASALKASASAVLSILFIVIAVADTSQAAHTDGASFPNTAQTAVSGYDVIGAIVGSMSSVVVPTITGALIGLVFLIILYGGAPNRPYKLPVPLASSVTALVAVSLMSTGVSTLTFLAIVLPLLVLSLLGGGLLANYLFTKDPEAPDEIA